MFSVSLVKWGGGKGPTHALKFKPVLVSRGQYKILRSELRVERRVQEFRQWLLAALREDRT